jgi:glycosyltransferase involved in cell wall biosynthesis
MKKKPNLLFITHHSRMVSNAYSVSFSLREAVFKKIGLRVKVFSCQAARSNFFSDFLKIIKLMRKFDVVYIRIDGSSILEKLSLVKFFRPSLALVWEIHGPVEEVFWRENNLGTRLLVLKRNFKRRLLSKLVDGAVCLTEELKNYSEQRLRIKRSFVIPSFANFRLLKKVCGRPERERSPIGSFLNNQNFFKVFWGGGAEFRWQALDLMEKVARRVYQLDKKILFFVFGGKPWYRFRFRKNIFLSDPLPHLEYLKLLIQADVCLSLYHQRKLDGGLGFYFSPLKLVESMALGKAVIATRVGQMAELINDGKNGLLTNNKIKEIVQKIVYLKKKPGLRKRIGREAQETIRQGRGLDQAAIKYKEIFGEMGVL